MAIKFTPGRKPVRAIRTEQEGAPVQISRKINNKQIDVQLVPLGEVKLWDKNPWNHQKIVPALAKALAIHGQVSAVIVWRKNNTIYKGNHTYRAIEYLRDNIKKIAKELDMSVEGIKHNIDPNYIKVEYRDFANENAATAYGLSDNNLGQGGKYDGDLLLNIIRSSEEYFTNTNITGFSEKDLKAFQLSTMGGLDGLARTDIVGQSQDMGEFAIVLFDSVMELNAFKQAFNMAVHERKVSFSTLFSAMTEEWQKWFTENIDDLPF